ncbi:MAG: DUF5916 domain-containing protein, partial [Gemmatimonadales bacterium]
MLLYLALFLQSGPVTATDSLVHRNGRVPRAVTAVRTAEPPRIDARLDDPAWAGAPVERGFRRDVPSDGNPASQETEVRVVYDGDAMYIGARLHDDRPDLIVRRLNRRDSFSSFVDAFFVQIDSYHDHRTAFTFGVTVAGERRDVLTSEDGGGFDAGWDPVWDVAVAVDSAGWVAEMRIPFSQLRFPTADGHAWGIQFRRDIVRAGEAVDWQWSPRAEAGAASKFGHLLGLENIPAPKRLEFLPYVSSQARLTEGIAPGNPFDDGSVASATGGLDAKYGITSDLTLNATINPDFGQVEADPSVLNLTAFETFFEERRPFFVEGANFFDFQGSFGLDRFFYTRRIGRAPTASALGTAPYVDEPAATSILGAAKFSGRAGGWSIGALDAVTGREYARVADQTGGPVRRTAIEPLTNFGVVRLRRAADDGGSGVGIALTNVTRSLDSLDFPFLRRSATVAAADFFHLMRQNRYRVSGYLGVSRVGGSGGALAATQASSARYYQRPDQDYAPFDPTRTSLGGYSGQVLFEKIGGDLTFAAGANVVSPGFELNDAGFQLDADRIRGSVLVNRNWRQPGKLFQDGFAGVRVSRTVNFGGQGPGVAVVGNGGVTLHDLSSIFLIGQYTFTGLDDRATRGGPLIEAPGRLDLNAQYYSDQRQPVYGSLGLAWTRARRGSSSFSISPGLTFKPTGAASLSVSANYLKDRASRFFLGEFPDPTATETFGNRYLFAPLTQTVLGLSSRIEFFFSPDLSLQVYAQPFFATA